MEGVRRLPAISDFDLDSLHQAVGRILEEGPLMTLSMKFSKVATLLLLAMTLLAENGLRGPISGYVFDAAERAIRPLVGVPGASYLGKPVVASLDYASVAPDSKLALAISGKRLFLIRGFDSGDARWMPLESSSTVDRVSWAANSDSVAVYSATTGHLRVWSDLKAWDAGFMPRPSPRGHRTVGRRGSTTSRRLSDFGNLNELGGAVSAIAMTEHGDVVAGIDDPVTGGLYLVSADRSPRLIVKLGKPGRVASAGERLFVPDRSRGEVLEIRNYRGQADIRLFAGAGLGVADPVAVGISPDRSCLIIANGSGKKLLVFDIDTRAMITELKLNFEPSRIERLGESSIFLLNARKSSGSVLEAFVATPRPAVYFIPAKPASASW